MEHELELLELGLPLDEGTVHLMQHHPSLTHADKLKRLMKLKAEAQDKGDEVAVKHASEAIGELYKQGEKAHDAKLKK